MNAYCDRQSVELNSIAFLFDGRRLRAEQTPDEVSLSLFACVACLCACTTVCMPLFEPLVSNFSCLFVQLEMEDGDEIDAMLHQTGGAVA